MVQFEIIKRRFARFHDDDCGAVTVDWVVLSAAIISMALASINVWRTSVSHNAEDVADLMSDYEISTTFD